MPSLMGFTGVVEAGFTPSGSLVAHWSADTIIGLEDGDPVGTWPDQANSYDLTQATAGNKPTYKTAIQNGLPIVRFDGGDYLEISDTITTATEGSFFAVWANTGDNDTTVLCFNDIGGVIKYAWHRTYATGGKVYTCFIWRNTSQDIPYGDTDLGTGFHIHTQESDDSAYTLRIDGNNEGLTFLAGSDTGKWWGDVPDRDTVTMGARHTSSAVDNYLTGDIAEVFLCETKNSDADRATNEAELKSKWDIP